MSMGGKRENAKDNREGWKIVNSVYTLVDKWLFPGVLWYLYEETQNDSIRQYAEDYTWRVKDIQYTTNNHDVGFMLNCSFGNGYRLTGNEEYKKVLLQGAESLSTRFNPIIGCIRSWDWNEDIWQFPVIIDNMMNLELLTWASKNSDSVRYVNIAKSHADVTMKHHFVRITVVIMWFPMILFLDFLKRRKPIRDMHMNQLGHVVRVGLCMVIR